MSNFLNILPCDRQTAFFASSLLYYTLLPLLSCDFVEFIISSCIFSDKARSSLLVINWLKCTNCTICVSCTACNFFIVLSCSFELYFFTEML